jgi:hypothetical protein
MINIEKIETEALAELAIEEGNRAKTRIMAHLGKIAAAKKVVENLEIEYRVLLRDIQSLS